MSGAINNATILACGDEDLDAASQFDTTLKPNPNAVNEVVLVGLVGLVGLVDLL